MTENKEYATFRMYKSTRDKLKYRLLPLIKEIKSEEDPTMIEVVDQLVDEEINMLQEIKSSFGSEEDAYDLGS